MNFLLLKKRFLVILLVISFILSNLNVFASEDIGITSQTILINGKELTKEEFIHILYNYNPDDVRIDDNLQSRTAAVVYFIPGIGQVAVLATGAIVVGGVAVAAGSWLWNEVTSWLNTVSCIPNSLKKPNGDVDLGKFNQKVSGNSVRYKEPKTGWSIDKDTSNHGGSAWKLNDNKGKRKASLDSNGKVLRNYVDL